MNLHGVLNKGQGRRFLAAGAVAALGLAIGAAPSMACAEGEVLLKLVKVVDGGTASAADWTLNAVGTTDGATGFAAWHSGVPQKAANGTYTLSEDPAPTAPTANYTSLGWDCTNSEEYVKTVTINNELNAEVTCTITNTYVPPKTTDLTLVKEVVGGSAKSVDWMLHAGDFADRSGKTFAVPDGTYNLSETEGKANYTSPGWKCDNSEGEGYVTKVTIGGINTRSLGTNGDNHVGVTCVITNTYVPPPPHTALLTLVKTVDGGRALPAAWTLHAGSFVGTSGTPFAVPDGGYRLSETGGPGNYSPSTWVCTRSEVLGRAIAIVSNTVDIGPNDTAVTCRITNTFVPPPPPAVVPPVVVPPVVVPPVVAKAAPAKAAPAKAAPARVAPVKVAPAVKTLAFTGAETVPLGLSGLLALVLGAVLTVASRRQRPKQARE